MNTPVTISICDARTQAIMDKLNSIESMGRERAEKIERLSARLYKDNGQVSVQTRLDRHEQLIHTVQVAADRMVWMGATALLGFTGTVIVAILNHVYFKG